MVDTSISGYRYTDAEPTQAHGCLLPSVFRLLEGLKLPAADLTRSGVGL